MILNHNFWFYYAFAAVALQDALYCYLMSTRANLSPDAYEETGSTQIEELFGYVPLKFRTMEMESVTYPIMLRAYNAGTLTDEVRDETGPDIIRWAVSEAEDSPVRVGALHQQHEFMGLVIQAVGIDGMYLVDPVFGRLHNLEGSDLNVGRAVRTPHPEKIRLKEILQAVELSIPSRVSE
jgi:hypothetical protein